MKKLFKIGLAAICFGTLGFLGGFVWTVVKILTLPKPKFEAVSETLTEGNNEINAKKKSDK